MGRTGIRLAAIAGIILASTAGYKSIDFTDAKPKASLTSRYKDLDSNSYAAIDLKLKEAGNAIAYKERKTTIADFSNPDKPTYSYDEEEFPDPIKARALIDEALNTLETSGSRIIYQSTADELLKVLGALPSAKINKDNIGEFRAALEILTSAVSNSRQDFSNYYLQRHPN